MPVFGGVRRRIPPEAGGDQGVRGAWDVVAKNGEASFSRDGSRCAFGSTPCVTVITTGGGAGLRVRSVGSSSGERSGSWSG